LHEASRIKWQGKVDKFTINNESREGKNIDFDLTKNSISRFLLYQALSKPDQVRSVL
jgi:hypothetical protein